MKYLLIPSVLSGFGDYLNSIPLPAILGIFKAEEWDGFGMITVESSLIYSIIDVLLGRRPWNLRLSRVEGRPYTTIETEPRPANGVS